MDIRLRVILSALGAAIVLAAACSITPQTVEVAGTLQGPERPPTTVLTEVRRPPADQVVAEQSVNDPVVGAARVSPQAAVVRSDGRAPVSLGFAGDTSFHNGLHLFDPLADAESVLRLPDLMVVNLETAVAPASIGVPPVQKQFLFRSDPVMVEQLVDAGVDAVSLANNHALDFGSAALASGVEALNEAGIQTVGGGVDAEAAYKPLIQTVGDWTVGIAAFSRVPCDWSWTGENVRQQVAWACPAFIDDATAVVADLVEDVDLAVVMVHGGTEGELCPDSTMRALNERWAALGAGLVVNSHPHVVQGVSSIGETVVVNSTGNFAFPPSFGLTANSAVFFATLSEQGLLVSVEPLVSEGGVVRRGSPQRRASILDQIDQYSNGWRVLADGRLVQDQSWLGLCGTDL